MTANAPYGRQTQIKQSGRPQETVPRPPGGQHRSLFFSPIQMMGVFSTGCWHHPRRQLGVSPMLLKNTLYREIFIFLSLQCVYVKRGDPGIEPGTSCTQSRNHTTRPIARCNLLHSPLLIQPQTHTRTQLMVTTPAKPHTTQQHLSQ